MKEKYKKSRKYLSREINDEELEEELLKASDKFVIDKKEEIKLIDIIRKKLDISSSETISMAVKKFIKNEKLKEIDNPKLFDAAVTIAYLRTILSNHDSQWKSNIEQARKYIKEQINDEDLEDEILEASEKLVKFFYKDST